MELIALHRRAVEHGASRSGQERSVSRPTHGAEWSVRQLVNHVVAEEL